MIVERDDVVFVIVVPWNDNDGGLVYRIGWEGVTAMNISKRHGLMDWVPYVEVWQDEHLHAEIPQHQTLTVEFASATPTRSAETKGSVGEANGGAVPKADANA